MKTTLASLRLLFALTVLTGLAYPLAVWAAGHALFSARAEGSLVVRDGTVVGSALFSQKTTKNGYFWPRPSADDFGTVASGASNLAWSSDKLQKSITDQSSAFRQAHGLTATQAVPAEMVTASASGLDPEISVAAAQLQASRVATARHLSAAQQNRLNALVQAAVIAEPLSPARINVLLLNLAVDREFGPAPKS